jgi:hypothetical protein
MHPEQAIDYALDQPTRPHEKTPILLPDASSRSCGWSRGA